MEKLINNYKGHFIYATLSGWFTANTIEGIKKADTLKGIKYLINESIKKKKE